MNPYDTDSIAILHVNLPDAPDVTSGSVEIHVAIPQHVIQDGDNVADYACTVLREDMGIDITPDLRRRLVVDTVLDPVER